MAHSNYSSEPWHGTLIMWAAIFLALGINIVGGKLLPRLELVILVVHVLGYFAILIPLTYMGNHKTNQEVFKEFVNGGFPTDGLSWFVGMTGCVFAFAGGDAAVHVSTFDSEIFKADIHQMAEEASNANVAIPRAILLSVLINGTLGFTMLIATLFCMGDVQEAIESPTGYPFMEIFRQATNSISGALGMSSILLIIAICSVIGMLAATSRQFWSFARDRGIPGWRLWSKVCAIYLRVPYGPTVNETGIPYHACSNILNPPNYDRLVPTGPRQHRIRCSPERHSLHGSFRNLFILSLVRVLLTLPSLHRCYFPVQ